jgi:hypothetical protein
MVRIGPGLPPVVKQWQFLYWFRDERRDVKSAWVLYHTLPLLYLFSDTHCLQLSVVDCVFRWSNALPLRTAILHIYTACT